MSIRSSRQSCAPSCACVGCVDQIKQSPKQIRQSPRHMTKQHLDTDAALMVCVRRQALHRAVSMAAVVRLSDQPLQRVLTRIFSSHARVVGLP